MHWFQKREKAALDAAVRSAGQPATELIAGERLPADHVFPAVVSHFGGNPYFEPGDAWPLLRNLAVPYDFVCQVNLSECPVRPDVPFGLFTVFFCWAAQDEAAPIACIVRTYAAPSPEKAISLPRPPSAAREYYKVTPCAIRTDTFMTYPWSMNRFPEIRAAASRFRNPDDAFSTSLRRLGFLHEFRSRVGGHATWVHDNTLEDGDLQLLAQIDYEPSANNCIGDAAPMFIAFSRSDPTHIETDCFQTF